MAIASSGAAMIFKVILNPTIGLFNKITGLDINWISDPRYALICVAVLTAWLNSGINFLYFSAGLGNIDESIYERASVDGANAFQKFFRLTLPGLSPIMFYTPGGQHHPGLPVLRPGQDPDPGRPRRVHQPHRLFHLPRTPSSTTSSAARRPQSVILFLIIMALTLVMFKIEKKGVKY